MVETNSDFKKGLDIKLSLDLSAQGKSPVVKRVLATDYDTLMGQSKKLVGKHGLNEETCQLKYFDGDSWVIVEDNDDLELAFAIAQTSNMKLTFTIKHPDCAAKVEQSPFAEAANKICEDAEMKEEPASTGQKKCKKDKAKGIPRKALKNLINQELDRQAQEVFKQLLKSDDLPNVQMTEDEAKVVHTNVACDGCGVSPIVGPRYKCSVRKNFDYCAKCEERLGSEHAMLKITTDGGAPDVMITMLDEAEGATMPQEEESKDPFNFAKQMMDQFMNGGHRGGRRGPGGRGGCGRGGRGGMNMQHMFKKFMEKLGDGNFSVEQLQEKFKECNQNWNNFNGKQPWKEARALCQKKPEGVIDLEPGMTKFAEIEVLNDTFWPWKLGCTLTLADEQGEAQMPVEIFCLPINQEVKGKEKATFQVPLTMAPYMIADNEKEYEVRLSFRGPKGQSFGETIILKVRCIAVTREVSEVDIYKLAIKLHEQLELGSLDECIKAAKDSACDEAESIKALQRKD